MDQRGTAYLAGWGAYHPANRLTNDELVSRLDTSHGWIDSHIGIVERRTIVRTGPDGTASDTVASMGAEAIRAAAKRAGCSLDELDLIVCATSVDDHDMPAAAARIGDLLGSDAFGFDVRAACSGWLVALEVARGLLASGRATKVAVCATEHSTLGVDPDDRASAVFFGDSSGAAILQSERPARGLEVLDLTWRADNAHHAEVVLPRDGFFHMDGPKAKAWVQPALLSTAQELLERNDATPADLRGLVCHQANLRLLEWFAATLGVTADRHWHDVEWAGNTFASGAATSLAGGLDREADHLQSGDLVLAVTVGAGHNVVGALLRWLAP